jgi:hypothetical protein
MKTALRNVGTFALLCAFVWGGWKLVERKIQHDERDRIANEQSEARFDSLLVASKRLDKIQSQAKQVVTVHATKYQTLRDTLRLTDTVAVKAGFAEADTTIKACFDFMNACELKQRNAEARVTEALKQRDYFKSKQPSFLDNAKKVALGVVIVYVAGNLVSQARR